tara:strand:- start:381 stop:1007 length:627 start_codon:yes stop_codon:yes gene_type:complete
MKKILILIKDKLLDFSDLIFDKTNQLVTFLARNLIVNFSNFLICIIFFLIFIFYQAIVEILNFELFGKDFTFGDSLKNLISLGFEATWNLAISAVRSFTPSGPLGLAFEVITETIALLMFLIGYIVFFLIFLIKSLWFLVTNFGLYNIVVILSWSYLIGLCKYIYHKIVLFIQSRRPANRLILDPDTSIAESADDYSVNSIQESDRDS